MSADRKKDLCAIYVPIDVNAKKISIVILIIVTAEKKTKKN